MIFEVKVVLLRLPADQDVGVYALPDLFCRQVASFKDCHGGRDEFDIGQGLA